MIYIEQKNCDFYAEISNTIRAFLGKTEIKPAAMRNTHPEEASGDVYFCCTYDEDAALVRTQWICGAERFEEETLLKERIGMRNTVRITVYRMMAKKCGRELPWGTLTGIRPVKLIHEMMDRGLDTQDIIREMKELYLVSDEKIHVSIEIAEKDRSIIYPVKKDVGIYIGIPFCPSRCYYCSFASNDIQKNQAMVAPYLEALFREMRMIREYLHQREVPIETVYIGGGTPTALDEPSFERLMEHTESLFGNGIKEFTCEAGRPDTMTETKLHSMIKHGVTRISINPQTMNNDTLEKIGRKHTKEDIVRCFEMARAMGFSDINMDLILGLEGEDVEAFSDTIEQVLSLSPDSVTLHALALKRAARLLEQKEQPNLNDPVAMQMMRMADVKLRKAGMTPYYLYRQKFMIDNLENVGYCRPGKACLYNMQIIEEKQTNIALGADAITKVVFPKQNRIERQGNAKDLKTYIEKLDQLVESKMKLLDQLYDHWV